MQSHTNTIVNGDCLRVLPRVSAGSINFILTDPPYITRYQSRDGRTVPNDDNDRWLKPAFAEMYRVLEKDSFCVSFWLAAGGQVHTGLPRGGLQSRGSLRISEAVYVEHAVCAVSA